MSLPRIVITAGEPAGIGPDVVLKALQSEITARIAVVADADLLKRRANMLGIACEIQKLDRPNEVSAHSPHRIQVLHTSLLGRRCAGHLECC
jgi:4-hydroxythreonine-4-phosphate dehydrogenase